MSTLSHSPIRQPERELTSTEIDRVIGWVLPPQDKEAVIHLTDDQVRYIFSYFQYYIAYMHHDTRYTEQGGRFSQETLSALTTRINDLFPTAIQLDKLKTQDEVAGLHPRHICLIYFGLPSEMKELPTQVQQKLVERIQELVFLPLSPPSSIEDKSIPAPSFSLSTTPSLSKSVSMPPIGDTQSETLHTQIQPTWPLPSQETTTLSPSPSDRPGEVEILTTPLVQNNTPQTETDLKFKESSQHSAPSSPPSTNAHWREKVIRHKSKVITALALLVIGVVIRHHLFPPKQRKDKRLEPTH